MTRDSDVRDGGVSRSFLSTWFLDQVLAGRGSPVFSFFVGLLPAPKKAFPKKGFFAHKPHKPWCPRHHLSGTHTPPTNTFIPPHPAETTERSP